MQLVLGPPKATFCIIALRRARERSGRERLLLVWPFPLPMIQRSVNQWAGCVGSGWPFGAYSPPGRSPVKLLIHLDLTCHFGGYILIVPVTYSVGMPPRSAVTPKGRVGGHRRPDTHVRADHPPLGNCTLPNASDASLETTLRCVSSRHVHLEACQISLHRVGDVEVEIRPPGGPPSKPAVEMAASQGDDSVASANGPKHSRVLEARADHGHATGIGHPRAGKRLLTAELLIGRTAPGRLGRPHRCSM